MLAWIGLKQDSIYDVQITITNKTNQNMTDFVFKCAVLKYLKLNMSVLSNNQIGQQQTFTQVHCINNDRKWKQSIHKWETKD